MSAKLLAAVLAAVLALATLGGCAPQAEVEEADLQDGVFTGYSEGTETGFAEVVLTLEDGEIVDAEVTEYDSVGMEKIYEAYDLEELEEAHQYLAQEMVEQNTWEVDAFTGATTTSEKVMEAGYFALQRAAVEEPEQEFFDGTFMGLSPATDQGWAVAWVTLEQDEIVDVQLEETKPQEDDEGEPVFDAVDRQLFEFKDEDYELEEWHEARVAIAEAIVEAQDTAVDAYTGATGSSENWMAAVEDALSRARTR